MRRRGGRQGRQAPTSQPRPAAGDDDPVVVWPDPSPLTPWWEAVLRRGGPPPPTVA
ncbi:hypothetical protein ACWF62_08915 [Rhodococcus sp. NPDC054953]